MTQIELVEHHEFPEDEYTKEAAVLLLEGKYRIGYTRKKLQNGGLFWSVVSSGARKNGEKVYIRGFEQDSKFVDRDIEKFLNERTWEGGSRSVHQKTSNRNEIDENERFPF